jgi:hypothetical protein
MGMGVMGFDVVSGSLLVRLWLVERLEDGGTEVWTRSGTSSRYLSDSGVESFEGWREVWASAISGR